MNKKKVFLFGYDRMWCMWCVMWTLVALVQYAILHSFYTFLGSFMYCSQCRFSEKPSKSKNLTPVTTRWLAPKICQFFWIFILKKSPFSEFPNSDFFCFRTVQPNPGILQEREWGLSALLQSSFIRKVSDILNCRQSRHKHREKKRHMGKRPKHRPETRHIDAESVVSVSNLCPRVVSGICQVYLAFYWTWKSFAHV